MNVAFHIDYKSFLFCPCLLTVLIAVAFQRQHSSYKLCVLASTLQLSLSSSLACAFTVSATEHCVNAFSRSRYSSLSSLYLRLLYGIPHTSLSLIKESVSPPNSHVLLLFCSSEESVPLKCHISLGYAASLNLKLYL